MCVTVYISAAPDQHICASVFLFHIFPHFGFGFPAVTYLNEQLWQWELQVLRHLMRCRIGAFLISASPVSRVMPSLGALKIKALKVCISCCPLLTLAVIYGCAPPELVHQTLGAKAAGGFGTSWGALLLRGSLTTDKLTTQESTIQAFTCGQPHLYMMDMKAASERFKQPVLLSWDNCASGAQEITFDSAFEQAVNPVKSITSESGRKPLCSIFIILGIGTHVYCLKSIDK